MSENTNFDPDQFLHTSTEGALDTEFPVVPAAQYRAVVDDIKVKSGTMSKGENVGNLWVSININWSIQDEALKEEMERDKVIVRQNVFLDVDNQGTIQTGKGKNVMLGRLRAAVGQNDGSAWSPAMLIGQMAEIDVAVGEYQGAPQNQIRGVAPITE